MSFLMTAAISALSAAFAVLSVCLWLDYSSKREERARERYRKIQMEYAKTTSRPAGLDFAIWADELKVRDWT